MTTINICICTYLRPKYLEKCLRSVLAQPALADASYTVTVIDNDPGWTAEAVVKSIEVPSHTRLYYHSETNRGIPHARNRALDESEKLGADYVAFIDDDEFADPDWLEKIYKYLQQYPKNTIIHGRVVPQYPENTPQYIQETYATRTMRPTGTRLETCATDNVIFPLPFVMKNSLRFDTSVPLAGGTDTKLFLEAVHAGATIYQCREAIVYEHVFAERLTIRWLMKRKYRAGITTSWRKRQSGKSRSLLILKGFFEIPILSTMALLFALLFQRTRRNKAILKAARATGIFAGAIGLEVNSYATIQC